MFKLPPDAPAELRYPIRMLGRYKYDWGLILPEEWLTLVGEATEELGLIIPGDPNAPPDNQESSLNVSFKFEDNEMVMFTC